MKVSDKIKLVQAVFSVEPGISLLNELEDELRGGNLYTSNTNDLCYRVGVLDHIDRLRNYSNMPEQELQAIIDEEAAQEKDTLRANQQYNDFGDLQP